MYVAVLVGDNVTVMPPIQFDSAFGIMKNALTNKDSVFLVFEGSVDKSEPFHDEALKLPYSVEMKDKFIKDMINLAKRFDFTLNEEISNYKESNKKIVTAKRIREQLQICGVKSFLSMAKLLDHVKENKTSVSLANYEFSSDGHNFYDNALTQEELNLLTDSEDEEINVEEARAPSGLEIHGLKVTSSINPTYAPGVRRMPPNIADNEGAYKIWQFVIKTYRAKLKETDDNKRKWAIAIILYKRMCVKKGIKPFLDQAKYKDDVRFKLDQDNDQVDTLVDEITSYAKENSLIEAIDNEAYETTVFKNNKFVIITRREVNLADNVSSIDFMNYLRDNFKFKRKGQIVTHDFSSRTDLICEEVDGVTYLKTLHGIHTNEVMPLVTPLKPVSNEDKIKAIHRLCRIWFETGRLKFRKKDL